MSRWPRTSLLLLLAVPAQLCVAADEFRVYTDQPRLFLRPQRLRLLKRERERQSMRWEQFHALVAGGAPMPEPGFANALEYAVSGDAAAARKAIDFALSSPDVRQVALIFDWCHAALTAEQTKTLAAKLSRAAAAADVPQDAASARNRVFAALAIADENPQLAERSLTAIIERWWRGKVAPALDAGTPAISRDDAFPLFEMMHAIRDNLNIDLRENAVKWFQQLPGDHLLSHYPATFSGPENEYRIPIYAANTEPDLKLAALSRIAEFMMVAFDNNSNESQFLQGWLMQDRFMLRGLLGAPYEFLWANPYQPGLSYFHFPLVHHDARTGSLFVRSSWEEDATWFGMVGSQMQLFAEGKITVLSAKLRQEPIHVGSTIVMVGGDTARFTVNEGDEAHVFVLGLKPRTHYDVEVDDEEMTEIDSDAAGILALKFPRETDAGVRIKPAAR